MTSPPWAREKIGITGGSGSLGTCLTSKLLASGAQEIVIFDQRPPVIRAESVRYENGSILNLPDLERGLAGCTIVFHLAALAEVPASGGQPLRYLEVNGFGTGCVMEACRLLGVPQVIYTSTSHVYGVPTRMPVDEAHPAGPLSLYAASKIAGEAALRGYHASFGIGAVVARLSNLYGGTLGAQTVIGRALDLTMSGRPIQLRSMSEVRDFLYIGDAADALVRLAISTRVEYGFHVVNVSTGCGIRIADAMNDLAQVAEGCGLPRPKILPPTGAPDPRVPVLVLDNRRLSDMTGYVPQTPLSAGLAQTIRERYKRA